MKLRIKQAWVGAIIRSALNAFPHFITHDEGPLRRHRQSRSYSRALELPLILAFHDGPWPDAVQPGKRVLVTPQIRIPESRG